jgi:hypothetical protein
MERAELSLSVLFYFIWIYFNVKELDTIHKRKALLLLLSAMKVADVFMKLKILNGLNIFAVFEQLV